MRELHIAKSISLSETVYNKLRAYMIGSKTPSFSEAIANIIVSMVPSEEEAKQIEDYMIWYNHNDFERKLNFEEARKDMLKQGYVRMLEIQSKQEGI